MNLYMVGVDFTRAAIAAREPLSFVRGQVLEILPRICGNAGVSGCVLLATCNRTELYVHSDGAAADALALLCGAAGVDAADYRALCAVRTDRDAARHLMEVAAGLHSQIFGDDQIVAQVKEAVALARQAQTADAVLDTLFRGAVTAGKRVKSETRLVGVPRSAAESGVCRAERFFGSLRGKKAVVIGNGEMGRLAAALLASRGCGVTVTLRTYRHGETVVPAGCRTHPYEARDEVIDGADLVFSATASPHCTVTKAQVGAMLCPPKLIVDLAMPRDVEQSVAEDGRVTVWNLDDLGRLGDENAADRARAAGLIGEALSDFEAWYGYRQSLPVIAELKDAALRRVRFDRAYGALQSENDTDAVAELAVCKTVDMLLGGMKEIVQPERLSACLEHMSRGMEE